MVKSNEWLPEGDIILEDAALGAVKDVNNPSHCGTGCWKN